MARQTFERTPTRDIPSGTAAPAGRSESVRRSSGEAYSTRCRVSFVAHTSTVTVSWSFIGRRTTTRVSAGGWDITWDNDDWPDKMIYFLY